MEICVQEVYWGLFSASTPVGGVTEAGWGPMDRDAALKVLAKSQGCSAARMALQSCLALR